jgi:hypothetical protein
MFVNNVAANNIYNQIIEIEELNLKGDLSNSIFYGITPIFCTIILYAFILNSLPSDIYYLSIASFFAAILISSVFLVSFVRAVKKGLLPKVFNRNKDKTALIQRKNEVFNYLSHKHIQIELLNFFELNIDNNSITNLKKYFALNQYNDAYQLIKKMIETIVMNEKQKSEEKESQEIISNYEKSLKNYEKNLKNKSKSHLTL